MLSGNLSEGLVVEHVLLEAGDREPVRAGGLMQNGVTAHPVSLGEGRAGIDRDKGAGIGHAGPILGPGELDKIARNQRPARSGRLPAILAEPLERILRPHSLAHHRMGGIVVARLDEGVEPLPCRQRLGLERFARDPARGRALGDIDLARGVLGDRGRGDTQSQCKRGDPSLHDNSPSKVRSLARAAGRVDYPRPLVLVVPLALAAMNSMIWPAMSLPVALSMPSRPGEELTSMMTGP